MASPSCVFFSDLGYYLIRQLQQFGKPTLILAKQEKLTSNSLTNQLGKNRNLAKLTSRPVYMRARIVVAIVVSL
jgi:hypothetical protein